MQGGKVVSYDKTTYKKISKFESEVLKHPAGLVVFDGVLFVADQVVNSVSTFDTSTGKYMESIIQLPTTGGKYVVESIGLSPC